MWKLNEKGLFDSVSKQLGVDCGVFREDQEHNVYPDIVIHDRKSKNRNLLIIEAKKCGVKCKGDCLKLMEFTKKEGDFHYDFGVLVVFEATLKATLKRLMLFRTGEFDCFYDGKKKMKKCLDKKCSNNDKETQKNEDVAKMLVCGKGVRTCNVLK